MVPCFDEAYKPTEHNPWTRFDALTRALRILVSQPISTIFVSTVDKLEQFAPLPQLPPSSRLAMRPYKVFPLHNI